MTMADLRDLLGTTRKYAVPIGEYLDRIGLTLRDGDVRRLGRVRSASHRRPRRPPPCTTTRPPRPPRRPRPARPPRAGRGSPGPAARPRPVRGPCGDLDEARAKLVRGERHRSRADASPGARPRSLDGDAAGASGRSSTPRASCSTPASAGPRWRPRRSRPSPAVARGLLQPGVRPGDRRPRAADDRRGRAAPPADRGRGRGRREQQRRRPPSWPCGPWRPAAR